MVDPDDIVVDGWDISDLNLSDCMKRSEVLDPLVQEQLHPLMVKMKPRPSVYDPSFIAENQVQGYKLLFFVIVVEASVGVMKVLCFQP